MNKKNKSKTKILKPKSGEKLQHILLAEKNALESIKLKMKLKILMRLF